MTTHPLAAGLAALAILVPLSIPLLSLTLGQQDVAALPTSTTARRAYDLLSKSFGPGVNGPLLIAVTLASAAQAPAGAQGSQPASAAETDPRAGDPRLAQLQHDVAATKGVAATTPLVLDKQGTAAYLNAISESGPAEAATSQLVERLRASTIPQAEHGTDMHADVGGSTAGYVDLASRISEKLPLQILVVILLSFLLLIIAFRTLVIPAQAAVMNLLSIGAAYGVLTAIFQYGWLSGLIGLDGPVPIVSYVPLFMFAVLFGLSMDYEVFLVTQIEERHSRGEDNAHARSPPGSCTSARVITSAAADHGLRVRQLRAERRSHDQAVRRRPRGRGDTRRDRRRAACSSRRMMVLMGGANWWMPRWLDAIRARPQHRGQRVRRRAGVASTRRRRAARRSAAREYAGGRWRESDPTPPSSRSESPWSAATGTAGA